MSTAALSPTTDSAPPRPRMTEARLVAYIVLGLIVAIICAYATIVRADFIDYDDNSHVFENPLVKGGLSWHGLKAAFGFHASLWIPLTWISFMADVSLFGLNPGAMHAENLAWHIASTVLLFLTLRRMTGSLWPSAFVAALFGLHPLNVESVAWIAERKSVLNAFFWFASIAAYARYAEKPRLLPYAGALVAMALALLAKPMAVTLPCTLLLLDVWPLGRWRTTGWRRLALEKIPFFLLSFGSCAITMHAPRPEAVVTIETLSVASRVSNALVSYTAYLQSLFFPVNLGVFYPHPIHPQPLLASVAALFLLVVTAFCLWSWKKRPYLLVGWLWFLGVLVPVIGLVQIGSQSRADRFCYVPEIGIFYALTWWVKDRWALAVTRGPAIAAAVVLGACTLLTARQVMFWQDGVTLFEHTVAVTKNNACAEALAGLHRAHAGDPENAIPHFQASLRIQPDQSTIWREFGLALAKIGKPKDAIEAFRMAVRYTPADMESRYQIAIALQKSGATAESADTLIQLLRDLPRSAGVHYYLARALEAEGRHEQAFEELKKAVRFAPGHPVIESALRDIEAGKTGIGAFGDL